MVVYSQILPFFFKTSGPNVSFGCLIKSKRQSEGFVRDLIHGIREQRIEDFRHYYRNLDLWLVDDINFIAGKDQTQEEFLHTFDDLLHNGRQIVVASRRFPQELPNLSGNLCSRLIGGVVTLLQPPGLEARLAFLEAKLKDKPVKLDSEILRQLAETITGNYSELEGALNSLLAYARNAKLDLTGETAGKVLQNLKFRAEQHSLI